MKAKISLSNESPPEFLQLWFTQENIKFLLFLSILAITCSLQLFFLIKLLHSQPLVYINYYSFFKYNSNFKSAQFFNNYDIPSEKKEAAFSNSIDEKYSYLAFLVYCTFIFFLGLQFQIVFLWRELAYFKDTSTVVWVFIMLAENSANCHDVF